MGQAFLHNEARVRIKLDDRPVALFAMAKTDVGDLGVGVVVRIREATKTGDVIPVTITGSSSDDQGRVWHATLAPPQP